MLFFLSYIKQLLLLLLLLYAFTLFIDFSIVYDVDSAVLWLSKVIFWQWKYTIKCNSNLRYILPQLLKDLSAMAARKEKGPNSAADSFCDLGQTA